jgi:hypothetical protein
MIVLDSGAALVSVAFFCRQDYEKGQTESNFLWKERSRQFNTEDPRAIQNLMCEAFRYWCAVSERPLWRHQEIEHATARAP